MNALNEQFVAEARELIQQANDDLIAAEREGFSEERIDRVFRVFHTLERLGRRGRSAGDGPCHACRRGRAVRQSRRGGLARRRW